MIETIADIVREMREFADTDSQTIGRDVLRREIQHLADRIEAAYKREATCEKSSIVGNNAMMHEALEEFVKYSEFVQRTGIFVRDSLVKITTKARAALAAPPRNCDIGTAEEQEKRWKTNCGHGIPNCKHCKVYEQAKNSGLVHRRYLMRCDCRFIWGQMPYEEGGAE